MEDLSTRERKVAVRSQVLRQRHALLERRHRANPGRQPMNAGGGGTQSREGAAAGRIAQRRLAMRITKKRAARRKPVEVRRPGLRMSPEAADPIVQVVDGDEQNVWPIRRLAGNRGDEYGETDEKGPTGANTNRAELNVHAEFGS